MTDDEPIPTRASLLSRLRDLNDDASWSEFDRTYRGLIFGVARRAGLSEPEAQEVVQATHRVGAALKREVRRLEVEWS